jgi:hypothetical protein
MSDQMTVGRKMQLTIENLSRRTGFPAQALSDFAQRGWLPRDAEEKGEKPTFDGLALLRHVGEVEDAD